MKVPILCLLAAFSLTFIAPKDVIAHCDSLDGPVVKAAQMALDTQDVARVLIWVVAADEPEIRTAFEKSLAVRSLTPQAKELADNYFFETVVRVHRAGEGATYTGIKPAGLDLGPAIPAADASIQERSINPVLVLLTHVLEEGLRTRFEEVGTTMDFRPDDVNAGRAYVKAYVEFIHYVERLHEAIGTSTHGHFHDSESARSRD
jgi:hypothetical protein